MTDFRAKWLDVDSECRVAFPRSPVPQIFSYDNKLNFSAWKFAKAAFYRAEPTLRSPEYFLQAGDSFVLGVTGTGWLRRHKKKQAIITERVE